MVKARTSASLLALFSLLLCSCSISYAYDLPNKVPGAQVSPEPAPRPEEPASPDDRQVTLDDLQYLYPGNKIYTDPWCGLDYTVCKYGMDSQQYRDETWLRNAIAQIERNIDELLLLPDPPQGWIEFYNEMLWKLNDELQNLLDNRKLPEEGDPCLTAYRECLAFTWGKG